MADSAAHVEGVVNRFGGRSRLLGDLDIEEATVFGRFDRPVREDDPRAGLGYGRRRRRRSLGPRPVRG
jgi:hypothetical protein